MLLGFIDLMLSIFILVGGLTVSRLLGRERFYLSDNDDRQAHYDVWVVEAFACLTAVGFFIMFLQSLKCIVCYGGFRLQDTNLFTIVIVMVAVATIGFYYGMVIIARRSELSYRQLKIRSLVDADYSPSIDMTIISPDELRSIIDEAKQEPQEDDWLELISISERAELVRVTNLAPCFTPEFYRHEMVCEKINRLPGWTIIRRLDCPAGGSVSVSNETPETTLKTAPDPAPKAPAKPAPKPVARPVSLEECLKTLSKADRDLVLEYFLKHPELEVFARSSRYSVRVGIADATEFEPRHVVAHVRCQ